MGQAVLPVRSNLGENPLLTLAVGAVLYAFSLVLIDIAPFFIGMYVDYLDVSLAQAGFVQTVDQAGGVLGAIAGFFLMPRVAWRKVIVVASIIATLANVLTAMADSYTMLLAVRFMSGFGVVLITTVTACILARSPTPDRAFGIGLALGMGLSAAAIWLLDWLRNDYGYAVALGSGALWLGAGMFLTVLLPAALGGRESPADRSVEMGGREGTPDLAEAPMPVGGAQALGRSALIALGLFGISVNVVYGYVERVGLANGLEPSGVASALALGYVFSAFGSLVPTIFGAVGGRMKWIVFTTVLFFASLWALYSSNSVVLYTVAFGLYASAWNMGLAYYMSLVAENDPHHRYTRGMYTINVAAQSIGPAIAAAVLTGAPLFAIFVISPVPALIAAALVITVVARIGKSSRAVLVSNS